MNTTKLNEYLGAPVAIDNRAGANGGIGAGMLARAKPDGCTILVGSIGVFSIRPWPRRSRIRT